MFVRKTIVQPVWVHDPFANMSTDDEAEAQYAVAILKVLEGLHKLGIKEVSLADIKEIFGFEDSIQPGDYDLVYELTPKFFEEKELHYASFESKYNKYH
jgi:hypothetical protein